VNQQRIKLAYLLRPRSLQWATNTNDLGWA